MSLNEVGWRGMHEGTDPGELPDTTRAGNYALSVDALAHSDCNVSTLDYYTWATAEEIPTYQPEWWGVVRRDGTLRTPAVAFAAAVRRARQARPALPICSGKPTRTPLRYGLKVLRKKGRCRAYRVTYRGYPINAIPVAGTDARRRKVGRITGKDGTVTLCGSKKGRLRVRAITGNWARSGWLRR
jgi:hypothetical protein